jgi:hypothetical protein
LEALLDVRFIASEYGTGKTHGGRVRGYAAALAVQRGSIRWGWMTTTAR